MSGRAGGLVAIPIAIVIGLVGCSQPAAAPSIELTVYAASSLAKALEQIRTAYATAQPGVSLTISTDSSAALATKIRQGASADLFLAADPVIAEDLATDELTVGGPVPFAGNRLTIIVPAGNPAFVHSAADLGRPGLRVVAAGDHVPVTTYAERLLVNLAREPDYSADFLRLYRENVVTRVDDVAAVVAQIELGEGDAAIVYSSDATSSKVLRVEVPDRANVAVTYVGVVTGTSRHIAEAQAFLAWLSGPAGRSVLGNFGFTAPSR